MTGRSDDDSTDRDESAGTDTHQSQVAQRHYEPGERRELTTEVISAVAAAEGVPPTAVTSPPLYESVDVSAVEDAFFGPDIAGESRQGVGTVEFQYIDYLVRVRSDGWIRVYERTDGDDS